MEKISACVVAYNEEKNIDRCLRSIALLADEIIVVHDGECTDGTLDIARRYTDKVFIRPHIGEAEPHRVFSFNTASGVWILQIDADEFLPAESVSALKELIADPRAQAYELLWPHWNGEKYVTDSWPHKLALFRKDKISYLAVPHFLPEVEGHIETTDIVLGHKPAYDNFTWQSFRGKWLKWAKIQAQVYKTGFQAVDKFNFRGDDWPPKIKLRLGSPLLSMPAVLAVTFFKSMLAPCSWRDWPVKIKYSLLAGMYQAMVNYNLWKSS